MIRSILLGILLVFSLMPGLSVAVSDTADWQSAKQKGGVEVFTAEVPGSNFLAFKATTIIAAPLERVLAVVMDHESYPDWYDNCRATEVLAEESGQDAVIRLVVKAPFPLSNRDLINRVNVSQLSDGVLVSLQSSPTYIPEVDGVVRMEKADGSWLLQSTPEATRVTQTYHADAKTKAPAWIVNRFIIDGPINSLRNLTRIVLQ